MIHYPEVMRRAQAQIDEVVGRDRLPSFSDRERLPYIEAMVKEVLRWRPVGPIGLPRQTAEVRDYSRNSPRHNLFDFSLPLRTTTTMDILYLKVKYHNTDGMICY